MKTIGVLGGIGPQATMEFERRLHRAAQKLIPPHFNGGYPPMVVHYCRHAPVIVKPDGHAELPLRPDPRLLEAAARIGTMVDFLVITSNGAHALQSEIEHAAGRPVLSMTDLVLAEVQRRGWKRVGVLALGEPRLYTQRLGAVGIDIQAIDVPLRDQLDRAIFRVMEGQADEHGQQLAQQAVQQLRERNVDGIILGCTEIPFLVGSAADERADLINPIQHLAEGAVRHAMT